MQNTLRDQLAASLKDIEDVEPVDETPEVQTEEVLDDRPRDEQGRFAPKEADKPQEAQPVEAPSIEPTLQRPTTWKKDYLPIWDKLATGNPLTPEEAKKLAEYSNQRENEYKTGVSTYKQEAEQAKQLQDAIAPFMPELQRYNIQPTQWIQNLGNAHRTLAMGTPEQKIQMFTKLAADYGVPLEAIGMAQQGNLDPVIPQIMQQIQNLSGQVNTVASWREQQEQQAALEAIKPFQDAEKYPHFEVVRETMAQLLERGLASDLQTAYTKAVRLNDEVWQAEQERQAQASSAIQSQQKAEIVSKAKSRAVSPKSSTPSGQVMTSATKDRRAALEEAFENVGGGRV